MFKNNKIIKNRNFEGMELYKTIGEYSVYYPTTEESINQFNDILSNYAKDSDNGIEIDSKDAFIKLFTLLTNVNMTEERYEKNAERLEFKLRIVLNYIKEVIYDTTELLMSEVEVNNREEKLGITQEMKNRNDSNVIQTEFKKRMHDDKIENKAEDIIKQGIENNNIQVIGNDIEETKQEIDDSQSKIDELKKQIEIEELEKKLAELKSK